MEDTDIENLRKQCITSVYCSAENVWKYFDSKEEVEFIGKLENCLDGYYKLAVEQNVYQNALKVASDETDNSNIDTLHARFTDHLNSLVGEQRNGNENEYRRELRKLRERVSKDNNVTASSQESDIILTNVQMSNLDPITKRPITNPVQNIKCNHIYDKEAILHHIRNKRNPVCPVHTCKCPLKEKYLKPCLQPLTNATCPNNTQPSFNIKEDR